MTEQPRTADELAHKAWQEAHDLAALATSLVTRLYAMRMAQSDESQQCASLKTLQLPGGTQPYATEQSAPVPGETDMLAFVRAAKQIRDEGFAEGRISGLATALDILQDNEDDGVSIAYEAILANLQDGQRTLAAQRTPTTPDT